MRAAQGVLPGPNDRWSGVIDRQDKTPNHQMEMALSLRKAGLIEP